jgi:hypothetical protein
LGPATQIPLHKIAFFCNNKCFYIADCYTYLNTIQKRAVVCNCKKRLSECSIALRHSALLILLITRTFRSHDGPVIVCGLDDPMVLSHPVIKTFLSTATSGKVLRPVRTPML